ncbi:MAG: hypothetical protein MUE49_04345 [Rhodospirillales bacterium]|nr:hypothetical protein [Rhodospirillales bacterium]
MSIPSSLFGVQRPVFEGGDRDCRLFKVQVASADCPPPRQPWREAAVIADREQFVQSMDIVAELTSKRVIETTTILMRVAADFGAAAVKSHDLVVGWRSRLKAEPCPDPRGRRWPATDEEFGGGDVVKLEEQFRVYTEQFLCLASQVASYSANMRASVSIVGLPTADRQPVNGDDDVCKKDQDEMAEQLAAMEKKNREYEQEILRLTNELQKRGRSAP